MTPLESAEKTAPSRFDLSDGVSLGALVPATALSEQPVIKQKGESCHFQKWRVALLGVMIVAVSLTVSRWEGGPSEKTAQNPSEETTQHRLRPIPIRCEHTVLVETAMPQPKDRYQRVQYPKVYSEIKEEGQCP